MAENEPAVTNPELEMLLNNKRDGHMYRERRQPQWDENYELSRDKVIVNRLTQRQSVNVPLMKTAQRTLLKDIDDMPVLQFENLDNDKDAELFKNEYWGYTVEKNQMELQDIVDKKQVFHFGRSYDQWQIVDGYIKMTIQDPMHILVSRFVNPFNIHSSRYLIHEHIYVPLTKLEKNKDYDQAAVARLKAFYGTAQGIIKIKDNAERLAENNKKMLEMGLTDVDNPVLGETIVELCNHFVFRQEGDAEEEIYLYVEADNREILMKKRQEEVIGVTKDHWWRNHYAYVSWADDVERQDWYSDGIADGIRTPNKILNTFFSQVIENRTLKNFNMKYYDSSIEGFTPPTNQPLVAGGWYPLPGKPSDTFQAVDVADLGDSLEEMNFIISMAEKLSGAVPTAQGVVDQKQITLGEVKLALNEAKDRIKGMSKFYTQAWKERGMMFIKLLEAAPHKIDAIRVAKKGRNTNNMFTREIGPSDWMTKSGYNVKVWSQDEKNAKDSQDIEKMNAVSQLIPNNVKLEDIKKRKLLEWLGLKPEDINAIMDMEQQKADAMIAAGNSGMLPQAGAAPTPQPPAPKPSLPMA